MSRKETLQLTKLKRQFQVCKVYQLKVDYSRLSKNTKNQLNTLFLEGKWLYNTILSSSDIKNYDTKTKLVSIKVQDHFEDRKLEHISSQMKQGLRDRMFQSILNLNKAKKKGIKVGKLKFKSNFDCIPLKQYDNTYKVYKKQNLIKIQGIRQKLKVRGLNQIPDNVEFANANFVKVGSDYYIHITTYEDKKDKIVPREAIGIDMGCSTQITLSNRVKLEYEVPVNKQIRRLDRKINKKVDNVKRKHSKNRTKDLLKRQKQYFKLNNKKKNIKDQVVSVLVNNYQVIVCQDENIKNWQAGGHGKKIQNTSIGGIIRDLKKKSHTFILVDKFFPSTQLCPQCNNRKKLFLNERVYRCEHCGYVEDRDVHAARNILNEGLKQLVPTSGSATSKCEVPTECRDFKPKETGTSVLSIFSILEDIVDISFCRKPLKTNVMLV